MIFLNILLYMLLFLLWIFLILLALLLLIIIIPIRYQAEGTIGSQTEVTAKVSWFFRLFRILYTYTSTESTFTAKIGPYQIPVDFLFESESMKKEKDKEKSDFSLGFSGVKSLLTNLDIKSIISLVIILMKKLCRKIMPKHLLVRGVVGFNDPCATGQFIGFYEAAAGILGIRSAIDLQGDFNQKSLELDLQLAGRFAIVSLIGPFIWFIWQRPVRDGIKIMRNKERAMT